jgi:chromosome segregation ATPase
MAVQKVVVDYDLEVNKAKASLNSLTNDVIKNQKKIQQSSKTTENAIVKDQQTAAQKRAKLINEEKQDLRELQQRRKQAYSVKEINEYNSRISETKKRIETLGSAEGKLQKQTSLLSGAFAKVGSAIFVAFSADRVIAFARESVKLAKQARTVRRAFENLNDPSLLRNLRESVRGTVSDLTLMSAAVRANEFNIALEELPKLFEFAKIQSDKLGVSTEQLVGNIVDGIGRKSSLVLDNLGISATDLQAEFKKTGDFAEAAGNVIERSMKDATIVIDDQIDSINRVSASYENLKIRLGERILNESGGAISYFNDVLKKAEDIDLVLKRNLTTEELEAYGKQYVETLENVTDKALELELILSGVQSGRFDGGFAAFLNEQLGDAITLTDKLRERINAITDEAGFIELIGELAQMREQVNNNSVAYGTLTQIIAYVTQQFEKFRSTLEKTDESTAETIKTLNEEIKRLREEQENLDVNIRSNEQEFQRLEDRIEAVTRKIELFKLGVSEAELNVDLSIDANFADGISRTDEEIKKAQDDLDKFIGTLKEESASGDFFKAVAEDMKKLEERTENTKKAIVGSFDAAINGLLDLSSAFSDIRNQQELDDLDRQIAQADQRKSIQEEILANQLALGKISDEEFIAQQEQLNSDLNNLTDERLKAEKEAAREAAIANKAAVIFDIILSTQQAIAKVTGQSGIAAPAAIPAILAPAAIAFATAAATPIPEFAEGVVGLQGAGTETSDDIPAMLSKGESVITAKATKQFHEELKAMNAGKYPELINEKYLNPVIKQLAATVQVNNSFDDLGIVTAIRKNKNVKISNADELATAIMGKQSRAAKLTRTL